MESVTSMLIKRTSRKIKIKNMIFDQEWIVFQKNNTCFGLSIWRNLNISTKATLVFLPGRWQNSLFWAKDVPLKDIRLFLVSQGYQVVTINYRTRFTRLESTISKWRTIDFLTDIANCILFLEKNDKINNFFLMGFSMGVAFAFLLPSIISMKRIRGLIALDGGVKNACPTESHLFQETSIEGDVIRNPAWDRTFRRMAQYKLMNSQNHDRDFLRLLLIGDPVWPRIQVEEMISISDYKKHPTLLYDRGLFEINFPIFCVAATEERVKTSHRGIYTASLTQSSNIETLCLPEWRHMDILAGTHVIDCVNKPVLCWIEKYE